MTFQSNANHPAKPVQAPKPVQTPKPGTPVTAPVKGPSVDTPGGAPKPKTK
jgi:hypothetical protein